MRTKSVLLVVSILIFFLLQVDSLNASFHDDEYEWYQKHIGMELGGSYAQEYYNLVRGNYRYKPKLAAYCVYAFSNGFQSGYYHGSINRQYYDMGWYPLYEQQLRASAESAYNYVRAMVVNWEATGLSSEERNEVELALYAGWKSGWDRGYREKGSAVPQPTNQDFRLNWSPGKSYNPEPSDDDPWGELRHRR